MRAGVGIIGQTRPDIAAVVEELARYSPADVAAVLDELRRMRAEREAERAEATLRLVSDEGAA